MNGRTSSSPPTPPAEHARSSLKARLRNRMTAGLILVIPIWITLLLLGFVFALMRDASLWIIEGLVRAPWIAAALEPLGVSSEALRADAIESLPAGVRWAVGALSVLLTIGLIYVLGMVTTNIVGRRLVQGVEALVDRVPFVKTIYRASKQVLETFTGESGQSFQRVVSVPFPSEQVRTVGFITRVTRDRATGEEVCAVFVPTSPNPTTGFVLVVARSRLIDLDWTVEEAVTVVMSGGVILPDAQLPTRDVTPLPSDPPHRPPGMEPGT